MSSPDGEPMTSEDEEAIRASYEEEKRVSGSLTPDWPVFSRFARRHFGRGRLEGHAEGRVEGYVEGRLTGRTEQCATAVLLVLGARDIDVPEAMQRRITRCENLERLEGWLERAAKATKIEDLFCDCLTRPW